MGKKLGLLHWQIVTLLLIIYDFVAIEISYFAALWLRFDCSFNAIPENYFHVYLVYTPIYAVICILVFASLRMYRSIWQFASYNELIRAIIGTGLSLAVNILGITLFFERMPISYYIFGTALQFAFTVAVRFAYRFVLLIRGERSALALHGKVQNVMIIGAGSAGQMIQRDMKISKQTKERVVCIIDDNRNKWKRFIDGVPVVGGRDDILSATEKYEVDKIYLAIPTASAEQKRDILNICKETGCELKNLPGIYQIVNGEVTVNSLKEVAIEDLLGREQIKVDMDEIFHHLRDKVIMVTGGGGSIGSELCRQIAAHQPKQLIIFEIYENNAYDIQQELKKKYLELDIRTIIGSVRDSRRVQQVFETYKPNIVYHAAAHKHVPLMEDSPCESIKNNAIGTYKTAYAAMANGCERFVLISTDKAVNPTNIMGASKRLCEMVIQTFDKLIKEDRVEDLPLLFVHEEGEHVEDMKRVSVVDKPRTEFVAVRFGNVLGSNGSVIPLFKKQIAAGGPVTVTHPDIIRYFMTIPEAVSLVLQAGTYAKGGEIFVLDMGEPVKIVDLANNLIKLSGMKPGVDIQVEFTGLRPGEKLYEEKLMAEEGMKTTKNKLIHIGCPIPFDEEEFLIQIKELMEQAYENDEEHIRESVKNIVKTYQESKV